MTWRCMGCSANSNDVTTPKLPPPPRTPQKRSGFSSALACSEPAVGGDDVDRLEIVEREAESSRDAAETRRRA